MAITYRRVQFIPLLLCFTLYANAQTVTGQITDGANPVEFCNVLIQDKTDTTYIKGSVSGMDGRFSITAKDGSYKLKVSLLGYGAVEKEIAVKGNTDLGKIIIRPTEEQLNEVVVRANLVDALADRYVMNNIGKQSIAAGKNSFEILKYAPGVWVSQTEAISINGQGGTKVMVNDRLLRFESSEQLAEYLRNIQAENIQKIEIIPNPTAEYDADSSGGILKFTVNRSALEGLSGSVSSQFYLNDYFIVAPGFNLNVNKNKWSIGAMYSYFPGAMFNCTEEYQNFYNEGTKNYIENKSYVKRPNTHFVNLEFSYDISKAQYFALAVSGTYQDLDWRNINNRRIEAPDGQTRVSSDGHDTGNSRDFQVSVNYVNHFSISDELKIKADAYFRSMRGENQVETDYYAMTGGSWENDPFDENDYLQRSPQYTDAYSAGADYAHTFNDRSVLTAGMKFTYLKANSQTEMKIPVNGIWIPDETRSDDYDYNENISALYVKYDKNTKKWAYTFSARAEYYATNGISNTLDQTVRQRILGIFPYVNIRYFIDRDKGTSLGFNVGRSIRRREFLELNPNVIQTSDFVEKYGNAYVKPSYVNSAEFSATVNYRYNFSFGYSLTDNMYEMVTIPNPEISGGVIFSPEKIRYHHALNLNAYLPVSITKWLDLMANLGGGYVWYNLLDEKRTSFYGRAMLSVNFTLPKNWNAELSWDANTSEILGNEKRHAGQSADVYFSKKLLKNKNLSIKAGVSDVFNSSAGGRTYITAPGYYSYSKMYCLGRTFQVRLRYGFNVGRKVMKKYIEQDSSEKFRFM